MKPIGYTAEGRPIIGPQPGPQTMAAESRADITFMGGPGGGGKSVVSAMIASRYAHIKDYTAVIFRRQYNDIVGGGGLWDISQDIYPAINGYGVRGKTEWTFPSGAYIKLTHLNNESDKYHHQGLAWACIVFDELPQFSWGQFDYLLTRNRDYGECSIKPFMFCTGNADADTWCSSFFQWWWNPDTGYAIPERSGKLRYFIRNRDTDEIEWVSPETKDADGKPPKSVTYIDAPLETNEMMPNREEYRATVMGRDRVTRERIGKGNWLISYSGGMFKPEWFEIVEELPQDIKLSRYWDLAATEYKSGKETEEKKNDPDWTSGAKGGISDGVLYIVDINAFRETPGTAELILKQTAQIDGRETEIWWEQEKASAGRFTSEYLSQVFKGFSARPDPVSGTKEERASKWAAWAEFRRVRLLRGEWNRSFIAQAGKFPLGKRDQIDSVSGLFQVLIGPKPILEYYNPAVHFKDFNKNKSEFNKINPQNVVIYVVLWMDSLGGIYGGCYLWACATQKLKLYNEIYQPYPILNLLSQEIEEKAIVPIAPQENFVTVRKILCNDVMARPGKSNVKKILAKSNVRIVEGQLLDENSGIHRVNKLFANNQLTIHTECIETDVQIRRMSYENKKIPAGYPMVRSLLMVEAHIKDEIRKNEMRLPQSREGHYSAEKMIIRDKLRNNSYQGEKKISEYEYLT
jgi:phage terminase large subunit-like protein